MSWLDDSALLAWTFGNSTFGCDISPPKWDGWFEATVTHDIKEVLDSSQRYIDIAGVHFGSLQRSVAFESAGSRDAFLAMIGQTKTLSNEAGRSRSAVLTTARYVNGTGPYYWASATFEAL